MKHILAEWHGYTVEVNGLSFLSGCVNVTTTDGTKPFTKYFAGAGCDSDAQGTVFIDSLENMRAVEDVQDPFASDDSQPEVEPEYDEHQEWQDMTSQLRRGDG
jgi:hypothetical protein